MSYTIAIAGKGGTGKTTLASLFIRLLKEDNSGSILAVDADPNNNLAENLGVKVKETVGSILDAVSRSPEKIPAGMPKDTFIEYQVQTSITEAPGFDLLAMGRPEGPGCYCYVNNLLREITAKLMKDYDYVVIDNEAGFEHLSRRTTRACDSLLVVSDATRAGLRAAGRINALVKELNISAKRNLFLINGSDKILEKEIIKKIGLDYIGNIPADPLITKASLNGASLMELDGGAVSLNALRKIKEKIWHRS
ncbi:MAG: AAA family ATPase [Candidatus Omnitrophica bacterium]|nr:AAA family ATPase [Candidatus Omnitrophota bacterium]